MIQRQQIKQAIDAIARRAPEIGRVLDELLALGRIEPPEPAAAASTAPDFCFRFDDRIVVVRKFIFVSDGLAAIERGLLMGYGEMRRKQEIALRRHPIDFLQAAREVHRAGLETLVDYELDLARERAAEDAQRMGRLAPLQEGAAAGGLPQGPEDPGVLFHGETDDGRPLLFASFPFCREALLQVAEINLEFFHVRRLLAALLEDKAHRFFAALSAGRILGLLTLTPRAETFTRVLEISAIATVRGRASEEAPEPPRGVGRFLVAGAYLFWQRFFPHARRLVLDSEIGARGFYERLGFTFRNPHRYELRSPGPGLLAAVLPLLDGLPDAPPKLAHHLARCIARQARASRRGTGRADPLRGAALREMIRRAISCRRYPEIAMAATRALLRSGRGLSEIDELLAIAEQNPEVRKRFLPQDRPAVGICLDVRFRRHLEAVFHLESPQRFDAIRSAVEDPSLEGKLIFVPPRPAAVEELGWVHTDEYIARIQRTAASPLTSLDLDTQAGAHSWEAACLAAGGVFALLEEIWAGRLERGFAAVRPPGHHAEADRAMGFCLFNNAALGARYLQRRHGVQRILILDLDAHHGNGIQRIFYDSDEVLFISLHQFPGFPGTGKLGETGSGRGEGFTVNVPLPAGCGEEEYLAVLHHLVGPIARAYRPEILLVPVGFDLWPGDRLARMRVSAEGYGWMTGFLVNLACELCAGRIAFILEGGYSAEGIRACGLRLLQALCRPGPASSEALERAAARPARHPALKKAIAVHRGYWSALH